MPQVRGFMSFLLSAAKYMIIFLKQNLFFLLFVFFILFFSNTVFSQGFCGTQTTPQQVAFELNQIAQQQGLKKFSSVPCLNKKLSIIAYIVKDSLGNPGITEAAIINAISVANKDFAPMCLSFEVCQFVYVNNFQYDNYSLPQDEQEMLTLFYKPQVINMYFVKDIPSDPQCGHAYFPGGPDLVVIKKPCIPGTVISHELGHFFGLYHTFESGFGAEFANESNCQIAGDLLCDTEADPQGSVDGACGYLGPFQDSNGDFYFPPVDNIMSYYGSCVCLFTPEQYMRMADQYLTLRSYLW